jgi:hypothetical protein
VYDLSDSGRGAVVASLDGHRGEVRTLAFSPDGTRLASGSVDKVRGGGEAEERRERDIYLYDL